jgi:predicted RNase H-like nuclease (RuvC/YqgF family)
MSKDRRIAELEEQVESLLEENESLWFILEELQSSEISAFDERITKALNDLKFRSVMTVTKAAEG